MSRLIAVYLTPPAVFVAVLIGGGYGTGREVVQFFSRHGLYQGLLGIALATVLFAVTFGLTFDLARRSQSYDYVGFFRVLIGRFWWLFEVLYLALALLVLSVLGAAADEMIRSEYGASENVGILITLALIALMVFFGRVVLERILTGWTLAMYLVFAAYFTLIFSALGVDTLQLETADLGAAGLVSGALYVMYNAALAPVLLFATRGIETRREAYLSGLVTAVILMLPATLFHLSFSLSDSGVFQQPLPVYWMIEHHAPNSFRILFFLALIGTMIQTGAGLIHGFIERVEHALMPQRDDGMPGAYRVAIAGGALLASWLLAKFGIIALIAQGYSALGVGFALIYLLPLLLRFLFGLISQEK